MSKQKNKTVSKVRVMDYLEYSGEEVDIWKLVCWLELSGDGLFYPIKGVRSRSMSLTEEIKRRGYDLTR